jgi:hypothetical protein
LHSADRIEVLRKYFAQSQSRKSYPPSSRNCQFIHSCATSKALRQNVTNRRTTAINESQTDTAIIANILQDRLSLASAAMSATCFRNRRTNPAAAQTRIRRPAFLSLAEKKRFAQNITVSLCCNSICTTI